MVSELPEAEGSLPTDGSSTSISDYVPVQDSGSEGFPTAKEPTSPPANRSPLIKRSAALKCVL